MGTTIQGVLSELVSDPVALVVSTYPAVRDSFERAFEIPYSMV